MSALKFRWTADDHALDVIRDEVLIGSLQWHEGRPPRFVSRVGVLAAFTLDELAQILHEARNHTREDKPCASP